MINIIKTSKKSSVLRIAETIFCIFSLCFLIVPYVWIIYSSFAPFKGYLVTGSEYSYIDFSIAHYISALQKFNFTKVYAISFFECIMVSVITVIISSMAAFALNRSSKELKKKGLLFFTLGIAIPFQMLAPNFNIIFSKLGLNNPMICNAIAISVTCIPISIYVYNWYFDKIPEQLIEASVLDGFSHMSLYYKIEFLYSKPATSIVVLICFISTWNDLLINEAQKKLGSLESLSNELNKLIKTGNWEFPEIFAILTLVLIFTVFLPYIFKKVILQKSSDDLSV